MLQHAAGSPARSTGAQVLDGLKCKILHPTQHLSTVLIRVWLPVNFTMPPHHLFPGCDLIAAQ